VLSVFGQVTEMYKLQLLPSMWQFEIYSTLKCTHDHAVHRGRQNNRNQRSVQCTEAGFGGLYIYIYIYIYMHIYIYIYAAIH
jgi:hypothetical protein